MRAMQRPGREPCILLAAARAAPDMSGANLAESAGLRPHTTQARAREVGGMVPAHASRSCPGQRSPLPRRGLGLWGKSTIYKHLVDRGCEVHALANSSASASALQPEAFRQQWPGDPAAVEQAIETLKGGWGGPNLRSAWDTSC